MRIGLAIAIVLAATVPFLLPYLELRRLGFSPRSLAETRRFSADVYAYFTADPNLRLWGPIAQAWPKSEGLLFPGLTIVVLAALGLVDDETAETRRRKLVLSRSLRSPRFLLLVARSSHRHAAARLLDPPAGDQDHQPVARAAGLRRVRRDRCSRPRATLARRARRWLLSPAGMFSAITLFAIVMSFGPEIHAKGRVRGDDQRLHRVLRPGAGLRRRPRARALRDDRGARARGAGGARRRGDRPPPSRRASAPSPAR